MENSETSDIFFLLKAYLALPLSFCLSSFMSFLNLKLQQLSKFEVKEHFLRFPSFRFWMQGKIKYLQTLEFFFFLQNYILTFPFLSQVSFFVIFASKLRLTSKFEVKENFPRFPRFRFWVYGKNENSEASKIFTSSSKIIS